MKSSYLVMNYWLIHNFYYLVTSVLLFYAMNIVSFAWWVNESACSYKQLTIFTHLYFKHQFFANMFSTSHFFSATLTNNI